ncbi:unnamed protein product [Prunus armeniaca]
MKKEGANKLKKKGMWKKMVNEIVRIRKSIILESLVRFCEAIETLYTRDYLRKPTPRDLQRLLQKTKARGFLVMIGSIDYIHKEIMGIGMAKKVSFWKLLHSFNAWVWHAFFRVVESQNDLNMLGQSPVFNDVLRGQAP